MMGEKREKLMLTLKFFLGEIVLRKTRQGFLCTWGHDDRDEGRANFSYRIDRCLHICKKNNNTKTYSFKPPYLNVLKCWLGGAIKGRNEEISPLEDRRTLTE